VDNLSNKQLFALETNHFLAFLTMATLAEEFYAGNKNEHKNAKESKNKLPLIEET